MLYLDAADGHRPFKLTATLRSGVGMDLPYGLDLAGVLAARVRRVNQAALDARGQLYDSPLPDTLEDDVDDLRLPLARCITSAEWHWAATCALPEDVHAAPETHTLFRQTNPAAMQHGARRPLPYLHASSGSYRDVMMPYPVVTTSTLTWWGVGDVDAVAALLKPVRSLGRRRAVGEGAIREWRMEAVEGDPGQICHVGGGERLMRPVPTDCADALHIPYRLGWFNLRPPSWHPDRLMELAMEPDPEEADDDQDQRPAG